MDGNRIIQLVNKPELLTFSDSDYIKQELDKYPFVQVFHYLDLKWKLHFSLECANDIEKLSVYSTHRELIKEMVDCTERKIIKLENQGESKELNQSESVALDEKSQKEIDNNWVTKEIKGTTDEMKTKPGHNESNGVQEKIENNLINSDQEKEKLNNIKEEGEKKDQVNINKLGISYLFTLGDNKKKTENIENNFSSVKEEKKSGLIELDAQIIINKLENPAISKEDNQHAEITNKEEEQQNKIVSDTVISDEKMTFKQWLSCSKNILNQEDIKELDIINKKKQKNIIEEFIGKNPKITPPKKGNKGRLELDLKKEEIKDIANLMTITLARLYVEQGRYDTAITAYKILSLKYPEKSSYFALEIKKIKKLK